MKYFVVLHVTKKDLTKEFLSEFIDINGEIKTNDDIKSVEHNIKLKHHLEKATLINFIKDQ